MDVETNEAVKSQALSDNGNAIPNDNVSDIIDEVARKGMTQNDDNVNTLIVTSNSNEVEQANNSAADEVNILCLCDCCFRINKTLL